MTPIDFAAMAKYVSVLLVGIVGWAHTRLDTRVTKLEDAQLNAVRQSDVDELKSDVRGLYSRFDDLKDAVIEAMKR
jgi:hypothetical protein